MGFYQKFIFELNMVNSNILKLKLNCYDLQSVSYNIKLLSKLQVTL